MNIHHIAVWTRDLELVRSFYVTYFACSHREKYVNRKKGFESYFLYFDRGASIEIMMSVDMKCAAGTPGGSFLGFTHLAISLGSKEKVDELVERFRKDGFEVVGEPRTTGDGYYEAAILDPEGNRIELVGEEPPCTVDGCLRL